MELPLKVQDQGGWKTEMNKGEFVNMVALSPETG